jgi:hypothetical protein
VVAVVIWIDWFVLGVIAGIAILVLISAGAALRRS